jgi:hypothetical protein
MFLKKKKKGQAKNRRKITIPNNDCLLFTYLTEPNGTKTPAKNFFTENLKK